MKKFELLSFLHKEIMDLCSAFVQGTTVHRYELAKVFTQHFQECEEPYLPEPTVFEAYYHNSWLFHYMAYYRNGYDLIPYDKFGEELSSVPSDVAKTTMEELYYCNLSIDSAFSKILAENRFEFDVIPGFMNSLIVCEADLILRIRAMYSPLARFDLNELKENKEFKPDLFVFDDINFFLDIYSKYFGNQKKVVSAMKKRYINKLNFNTREKKKIASLYLIKDDAFLFVKNYIISFYLIYYNSYNDFEQWYQQVKNVISTYMVILFPKLNLFVNGSYGDLTEKTANALVIKLYQILTHLSTEMEKLRVIVKKYEIEEKRYIEKDVNLCNPECCEWLYNKIDNPFKESWVPFLFAKCNSIRKQRIENLRAFFSLGSFSKQSAFARSLKENLCQLTKNADLFFEDKDGFKQLSDIYHRGLLRFFWKYETIKKMKKDYVELSQFIKEEGSNKLFQKDGDTVRIKFNALDEEGWWVEKLLGFEYKPAHSADNYNKLIEALFEGRTSVKIGDREVSVHVVLFLIMFYYWIFISLEAENSDDIRFWSHCIFHKVLPVG